MSLMSVGRLFQTSGPLTENARQPNCIWHTVNFWIDILIGQLFVGNYQATN